MPSTAIRSQSYDEVTQTLFVTFVDGDLYAYFAVPAAVAQAFARARSKGRFFAYEIRNRYAYRRMDPDAGCLAATRRRSAFSLMKPAASRWS